ncbi:MAG: BACON domain-containing protein, partial [Pseudobutyrivibrio sp.]|nr:BACON domain-containing protein [Pseudobutyrivibrio sp.]
ELRTDANTTRKERTATITIRTKGGVSQTVEVKQSLSDVILDIAGGDNQVLEYEASATDSKNFAFTCNTTWEITTTESWIHCDKKEGGQAITTTQSATVGVTVDEIQTDVDREGIIVVSAENGAKTKQITVKQTGKIIELSVSPKEFSVEATGAQKTIQIACNADWTIEFDKGDIVCETTTGTGNRDVVIDCQPNNISSERTITLTVSSGIQNIKKETVTFVQKAATPPELTGFSIVQSSIKKNEATFKLSFNSMYKLQEYGVFYSKNSNMNNAVKATVVEDVSGVNEIEYTLTGLESMTTYYVYGYIHNTVGDSDTKSNIVLEFTTAGVKPGGDDNPTPNLSRRKK